MPSAAPTDNQIKGGELHTEVRERQFVENQVPNLSFKINIIKINRLVFVSGAIGSTVFFLLVDVLNVF